MKFRLPLITTVATYILIILGVLVVGFKAGLACSDWPLCNGHVIPPLQGIILVEFAHRTFTTLTGMLIVTNAIVLWRNYRFDRLVRILSVLSVLLLGLVGVMGGVNVLNKLPPGLTAIDMAFAMLLLSVLVVLTVRVSKIESQQSESTARETSGKSSLQVLLKPALFAWAAVYLETLIGGFFKHSKASYTYVYPTEPLANALISQYQSAQVVMYVHMFASFLVVMALFRLLVYARKEKAFFRQTIGLLILLGVQAFLGFFSLVTKLELFSTTAHMAVASLMLAISSWIAASVKFEQTYAEWVDENNRIAQGRTVVTNG
ncbi:COX15/CtaA family protein [Effusibacillus pohliae]|uniref:COX15/CtaA family protein n=1 Tax=Effusibacillus pohliae TaxID=232270 RepID=UPI0003780853|nr:COX15/CtaA family protein [Effusibacillus pohliae]